MRAGAELLANGSTRAGLAGLLRAARLASGELIPVDPVVREALGFASSDDVLLAPGAGTIRVLLVECAGAAPLRDQIQRIVNRVASRAPHVPWLIAAAAPAQGLSAIASWRGDGRGRRIAAFIWEPARVVDSDAETVCALHAAHSDDDVLCHARYLDVLGRDALTRRFYRALAAHIAALAGTAPSRQAVAAREVSLLYVTRLLFLCFLEAKGWLNHERAFLSARYDECMLAGGGFHRRVLLPLFFGTLNTPPRNRAPAARRFGRVPFLNGGLFTRTLPERECRGWRLPDEQLGALLRDVLQRYRFVAREDSATWSEASIDPEMLGRAFETLMAGRDRKAGGVFFTPHPLVARVTDEALLAWSSHGRNGWKDVRILDPACGSGAFLVYALESVAGRRLQEGESASLSDLRRDVLARCIFGVDRDPTAVWLCELRLWLSVVIESDEDDPLRVPPLPNLDRNIRVGDALAGVGFGQGGIITADRRLGRLRAGYVRATGRRKLALGRALDREERRHALARLDAELASLRHTRREQLAAARTRNLFGERSGAVPAAEIRHVRVRIRNAVRERRRIATGGALPFSFATCFAEAHAAGGFDIVFGNPPWVRLHRIPEQLRAQFRECFEVYRHASWAVGARRARAGAGFASQVDLAALFAERATGLLRCGGVLSLLLPAKLWQSLAGGGIRRLLLARTRLLRLEDMSEARHAFNAAVYPSLILAQVAGGGTSTLTLARHDRRGFQEWAADAASLPLDATPGAPWLLLPPRARSAFTELRQAGVPLAETGFGPPRLGVKSGCNAAFLVRLVETRGDHAVVVDANGERGRVETAVLRPALRGEAVLPWAASRGDEWILWTHDERGPLPSLPEQTLRWLLRHRGELAMRSDARRARRWWSLFRVDAAATDRPRVVWADFGRRPRALVLDARDPAVPLNTCYVTHCRDDTDAWALAGILNSPLAAAWLNAIAERARGDYRRYMGWTVGQLPLPLRWDASRAELECTARRLAAGSDRDDELLDAVLQAYGVSHRAMHELLSTCDA